MADERSRQRAQRDRRIVWPERRCADLFDRLAGGLGENGNSVDVAELALIGRHAGRGVTLDEFDAGIALACR